MRKGFYYILATFICIVTIHGLIDNNDSWYWWVLGVLGIGVIYLIIDLKTRK